MPARHLVFFSNPHSLDVRSDFDAGYRFDIVDVSKG
jgi:hypothetical protein